MTGDPFEWYHAITRWGYHPGTTVTANPLVAFVANLASRPYEYLVNEHAAPYDVLNGLFPMLMVVVAAAGCGGDSAPATRCSSPPTWRCRSARASSRAWAATARCCSPSRSGWRR